MQSPARGIRVPNPRQAQDRPARPRGFRSSRIVFEEGPRKSNSKLTPSPASTTRPTSQVFRQEARLSRLNQPVTRRVPARPRGRRFRLPHVSMERDGAFLMLVAFTAWGLDSWTQFEAAPDSIVSLSLLWPDFQELPPQQFQ